jgi:hypothetical protein
MNWMKFVRGEVEVQGKKSNGFYLDQVMVELAEQNTLANWVRDTNHKIYHY